MQVELSGLEFLVCMEECVNEDEKKEGKEKEKKRTLSVCCVYCTARNFWESKISWID